MMANLFSSFDPTTNSWISLNWMSSSLFLLIVPSAFWVLPSRYNMLWIKIMNFIHSEFKILIKSNLYKGSTMIFTSLFLIILINNFMGLFPYIFTCSSHMNFALALSLPLWMGFMLFGWINNTTFMFAHLVPQGAPQVLLPFLIIVETISNVIRPGTLAIRLTANMIAGHLLLTLLGNSGSKMSMLLLNLLFAAQIMLLLLESAVAMIQAYVFSILATLYSSEIN